MTPRRTLLVAALVAAALGGTAHGVPGSRWEPGPRIDVADFHEILAPHGDWLAVVPWGLVWTPSDIEPGWRPYTHGRWTFTHLGWTWVSSWEWGWAPFHYGRWSYHRTHGWIWIPGRVWAPGWVAWRSGDDWVGWAPLPPQARWRVGHGLELEGDLDALIPVHGWSFAGERDFVSPRVEEFLAPLPRNGWLVRQTENVTRYAEEGREVAVYGPDRRKVERSAGTVEVSRVREVSRPPTWSQLADPGTVHVYRPEVADAKPRPKPADAAPPGKPSAGDVERRRARELRRIEDWAKEQQRELDRQERQERGKPPAAEAPASVELRRQEEREALAREVAREKELLEGRLEREVRNKGAEKKPPERRPPAPGQPSAEVLARDYAAHLTAVRRKHLPR